MTYSMHNINIITPNKFELSLPNSPVDQTPADRIFSMCKIAHSCSLPVSVWQYIKRSSTHAHEDSNTEDSVSEAHFCVCLATDPVRTMISNMDEN